jgi:hypothetical protein
VGLLLAAPPGGEVASKLVSIPVSSCVFVLLLNFHLYNPLDFPRPVYHFLIMFCFDLYLLGAVLSSRAAMSSSSSSKENSLADIINPYMRELKMHPKELSLEDGKVQIEDVRGPKGEGSLEARMEELEQEVFRYKTMAERKVDIIHRINQELIAKHKKETVELWDDTLSLHETTNKL